MSNLDDFNQTDPINLVTRNILKKRFLALFKGYYDIIVRKNFSKKINAFLYISIIFEIGRRADKPT